ncbi:MULTISPECIES: arginine--tRNA ligase [Anaerococcus]|uniref:Arginine--tRNA ligase n=1 Tax=Anaerococcus octavius TaxID=54007 RepID=A0A2I1MAH8_9FIRM|nr:MULTISPECIES: arginine--tRNA ligase [Anaerococcus]MBS6105635.1 arginine--tRNA ligase [Anaerococcus sp.]PKZ17131.1 arginine--tRNA ligase [Anaerococcus octavius]
MKDFKEIIAKKLENEDINLSYEEIYNLIEIPPQDDMGDYSFPCFTLAKVLRKSPVQIASDLAENLEIEEFERIENINAYLNFYVDRDLYQNSVLNEILDQKEDYGKSDEGNGKNIVIDFSSVNIAKPFHIGHIRSTVQGDAIRNIHEFLGYNVIATNYLGDYGTQFGTMIAAYKLWGNEKAINTDPINELLKLYVRYNSQASEDPEMKDAARSEFKNLEDGDPEATKLWQWFKDISLREFERVYGLLDIHFDDYNGESYNSQFIPQILELLKEKDLLVESDGAQIIDLSPYDLTPAIIIKSNGSSSYITRDIGTAINRKREYDFKENLYVVATQQNLHYQQLRKILELMGYEWWDDNKHIAFGMVSLKDQTMSTRKGQVVFLEDVLNKAIDKTKSIMEERGADIEDIDETAKIVGIGAVKFQELYNNRIKDYVFDWDEVLNFDGETGPYVQYTYARAKSVLRKAEVESFDEVEFTNLKTYEEFALVKTLAEFGNVVAKACEKYEPSLVTRHLTDIAKAFNKFYNSSQIMVDDKELRKERLALTYATSIILKSSLGLLGIKTVEKM